MRKLVPITGVIATLAASGVVWHGLTSADAASPSTATSALTWGECEGGGGKDGMECATLQVPLDWSKPDGRQISLAIGRLRADGSEKPKGSVLVNYGGPGQPGIMVMRERGFTFEWQPFGELRHQMNIVTWDPRGFGGLSTPNLDMTCHKIPGRRQPDLPHTQTEFEQLAATNKSHAEACRHQDPELFDHMDAYSNARDMEAIRIALGESTTNLYMGSYGSVYGQTYARLYPDRVRTMVIDGGLDHTAGFERGQIAIARDNRTRMRRFTDWCAGDPSCALHGQNVAKLWQRLVAHADRNPLPVPAEKAELNGWTLRQIAFGRLVRGGRADWPKLAKDIAAAAAGDASGLAFAPGRPYPPMGYPVSECHEWPSFTGLAELKRTIARVDRIDPNLGAAGTQLSSLLACVGWPAELNNPPAPLPKKLPPLLAVGSWTDFPASDRSVRRIPGSRSIRHDETGHELYTTGNTCVIMHVDRYLANRALPPRGTRC